MKRKETNIFPKAKVYTKKTLCRQHYHLAFKKETDMNHKPHFRTLMSTALAILTLITSIPVVPASAASVDRPRSIWIFTSLCPAEVKAPCYREASSLTTYDSLGMTIFCLNDQNPMGYKKNFTYYSGWRYKDLKGTVYTGMYRDAAKGAILGGPYKVVSQRSYWTCYTGLAGIF
jgi:hypothetical protein